MHVSEWVSVIIDLAEIIDTSITDDSIYKFVVIICNKYFEWFHFCEITGQRSRSFSNLATNE